MKKLGKKRKWITLIRDFILDKNRDEQALTLASKNDAVFGGMKPSGAVRRRIAIFSTSSAWLLALSVPFFSRIL